MDETITFRITISGTYAITRNKLQEYYDTDDPRTAAELDLIAFSDSPIEGVVAMEAVDTVTVKIEESA